MRFALVRASGTGVHAGVSAPWRGPVHLALEFSRSTGGDESYESYTPQSARPGDRMLTSYLLGIEARSGPRRHGAFAFVGAGVGHSSLTDARGVFAPPCDRWIVPPRRLTALALGAGIGQRLSLGLGELGFSFALRMHLMPHSGQVAASGTTLTLGFAY